MTVYYKATRPDGLDFHTGTVDYAAALATGEVITHPAAKQTPDDPSTYLSVATVPTDCTGMSWPCRLFTVAPVGRALKADGSLPNKRRVKALRVTAELPAHEVFGPQGVEVVALIERASRLTVDETRALDAARGAARDAARDAAWDAAWDAARGAARDAARYAARYAARDAARYAARYAARSAAESAALALVVGDLITPEQFDLLYGPWASVVGEGS